MMAVKLLPKSSLMAIIVSEIGQSQRNFVLLNSRRVALATGNLHDRVFFF